MPRAKENGILKLQNSVFFLNYFSAAVGAIYTVVINFLAANRAKKKLFGGKRNDPFFFLCAYENADD